MSYKNILNVDEAAKVTGYAVAGVQLASLIAFLLLISHYSYALFHGLGEMFTVAVAFSIFAISWSSRRFIDNSFLVHIGSALLFVAFADTLHIFAYKGISIIPGSSTDMATQLWIAARLLTGVSFIAASLFIYRKITPKVIFFTYFVATVLLVSSIISWRSFPVSYVEGSGLTPFKIYTEYVIMALYFAAILLLRHHKSLFESRFVKLIMLSLSLMMVSELFFTYYLSPFDFSNLIGHLLKIVAYYVLYLAIVETGLMKPYRVLFKNLKDREVAAVESEERYRTLVENSPSAIVLHSEGKIVYVNPAGVKLFAAQSEKDILGKSILDFIASNSQKVVFERLDKLLNGERVATVAEIKILTLEGKEEDVEVSGSVARLQGKSVIQTVFRNISNRKNFERQLGAYTVKIEQYAEDLNKFKLAVENASDAIYITDDNFQLMYANRAAEKTTGYFKSELVGKTTEVWRDISDAKNATRQLALPNNEILIKTPVEQEVVNKKKNGQKYTALLEISPILDEKKEVLYYVIIERDISRQKEIDQAKNEFISLASHQLRTPLASIALSSELLLRGVYGEISEKQRGSINEIFDSSDRMKELISDLLNISRIELGTLAVKLEPASMQEQIEAMLKDRELLLNNKSITLETNFDHTLPKIEIDKNILEIVIDNLISNAIRYTAKGGRIKVSLDRHGDDALLTVADNGCGIPVNEQSRIFEKFYRADNAQAISAEGSGLGLYMIKTALKKVGASIWVESVEGEGSKFIVRWPIRQQHSL
jgi:PAS domain S-box-containing protein